MQDWSARISEFIDNMSSDERLRFIRRIQRYESRQLVGEERDRIMTALSLVGIHDTCNNQVTITDVYFLGSLEYHVVHYENSVSEVYEIHRFSDDQL